MVHLLYDIMDESSAVDIESNPEQVIAKGYGLSTGLAGQPNIFQLDARNAGFGDFDVVVKGASRATIEYLEEDDAFYKIKYHVSLPGDYQIEVKYDMKHIPGSPFTAKVMNPNTSDNEHSRLNSINSNSVESFSSSLNDNSGDESSSNFRKLPILADIKTPSGNILNGLVVRQPNGKVSVQFQRKEVGTYTVTLTHKISGKVIAGSPYEVIVKTHSKDVNYKDSSNIDSSMNATGDGLRVANVGETNCFTLYGNSKIDLSNLCIAVVGNAGIKLRVFQNDALSIDIVYEVKKAGTYFFHVHENSENIPGSPFEVQSIMNNTWSGNSSNSNTDYVATVTVTLWCGSDNTHQNLTTEIKNPYGSCIAHTIVRRGRHLLEARFLPNKNGQYYFKTSFDDCLNHLFPINVNTFPDKDDIFKISGDGLYKAFINKPANVMIDSVLPISRSFSVEFDGPAKVNIVQSRSKDGTFVIVYSGRKTGQYLMSIKYDGFHIHGSPFHVKISDTTERTDKLAIDHVDTTIKSKPDLCRAFGPGLSEAISGKISNFTVDALHAGSGALMTGFDDNKLSPIEIVSKHVGNCVYDVHYTIETPGFYKLSVLWAGAHISGSPFNVKVYDENNN